MNRKVLVGPCDVGQGVFAAKPIAEGEIIIFLTGRIVTRTENNQLALDGANSVQIDNDRYVVPTNPGFYLNHSCEPNAGLDSDLRLVALRDIAPGEEIRFDYSTSMLERDWTLECKCGSPRCRGVVDDFDRLPKFVRDFYADRHVVQEFILSELDRAFADNTAAA